MFVIAGRIKKLKNAMHWFENMLEFENKLIDAGLNPKWEGSFSKSQKDASNSLNWACNVIVNKEQDKRLVAKIAAEFYDEHKFLGFQVNANETYNGFKTNVIE